jgi:hypothetical protein
MPGLGGLRRPRRDSPNMAWRNPSFRGYADYMQTPTFRENLDRCIELAQRERVVLMCAEAVPWRCHRSLIADALLVKGIEAREITSGVRARPHSLTQWARVTGTRVTYPAAPPESRQSGPCGQDDHRLNAEGEDHVTEPQGAAGLRHPRD